MSLLGNHTMPSMNSVASEWSTSAARISPRRCFFHMTLAVSTAMKSGAVSRREARSSSSAAAEPASGANQTAATEASTTTLETVVSRPRAGLVRLTGRRRRRARRLSVTVSADEIDCPRLVGLLAGSDLHDPPQSFLAGHRGASGEDATRLFLHRDALEASLGAQPLGHDVVEVADEERGHRTPW